MRDTGAAATEAATEAATGTGRPSRRRALRWAGASAAIAVAGMAATARPAAAADPNDVVKDTVNTVAGTTTLRGSVDGSLLEVENTRTANGGRAIRAISNSRDTGAVRGDNTNADGVGGVGLLGWAPSGRDLVAFGSGRIGMDSHTFDLGSHEYTTGELHHSAGTLYTMVTPTVRRSVAGPTSAGALYPIEPVRVYDSRLPQPNPGKLAGGESRQVSVANGRDLTTGAVIESNVVPSGATAVVFNLTVTGGESAGHLAITPGGATTYKASIVNFATGATLANASMIRVSAARQVKIFASGGPVHFILDISGYYL